jgi:hypothetical protein
LSLEQCDETRTVIIGSQVLFFYYKESAASRLGHDSTSRLHKLRAPITPHARTLTANTDAGVNLDAELSYSFKTKYLGGGGGDGGGGGVGGGDAFVVFAADVVTEPPVARPSKVQIFPP